MQLRIKSVLNQYLDIYNIM